MKPRAASTATRIRQAIEAVPAGEPFVTALLLSIASRSAVDQTLSRLVRSGELERISRGVFVRPLRSRFVGKVLPPPAKVAETVARASGAAIYASGAEAARRLELTTQVPTQTVFLTPGPGRRLTLGKLRVTLKHVSPRKLILAGTPAGEAISALWYLGRRGVDETTIHEVRRRLAPPEFQRLLSARGSMPGWMARAISSSETNG